MRRLALVLVAAGMWTACSDSNGVDPDAIDQGEFAAVRSALDSSLATDPQYPTLAVLVLPFVDRASHHVDGSGDTTRLAGIELDIDVDTDSGPLVLRFTAILGWTGYHAATRTMDSVFFVAGAGLPPVTDSLKESFSPDSAGTGTALVMHQAIDSSVTVWQTGVGRMVTTGSSYGGGRTQVGGGLTLTVHRGTLMGNFQIGTAYQVPDSATTVSTAKDFSTGARAMKVVIRGTL